MQLGQRQSCGFGSLLSISALTHSHFSPLSSPSTSLSSAFLSILNISLHSHRPDIATATCERMHTHRLKACCLATQGWDRCRPIREARKRAVNGKRKHIERRVLLHFMLKQQGFNHFLTFGSTLTKQLFNSFPGSLCWYTSFLTQHVSQLVFYSHLG